MVDVWAASRVGNVITLSDGRVFDLDSYPGNGWTEARCANITDNIQRNHIDHVVDRNALPADDPEKTWTAQQFADRYGNFFVELNTQGQKNEVRFRRTVVRVFPAGGSFDVSWSRVSR